MASSGMQVLGFLLSLIGVGATVAAIFMVEWKRIGGELFPLYEGLWMTCSEKSEVITCEYYESLLEVPAEIQLTRSVLLVSIILSTLALFVSTMGMKCTRFMDGKAKVKSHTAMVGGIMFIISGLLTLIITALHVKTIVDIFHEAHGLHKPEIGKAAFISCAGGLLTMGGGAFLSCRRCSRSGVPRSNHNEPFLPSTHSKSNYV